MLPAYERLGLFYLGRRFDLPAGARLADPVLYDSKDLVTHAVCIGMTGSGKTGLGIVVIEEAALDSIPVLAIDPKGDLSNLLLTFPDLDQGSFAPWVDPPASAEQIASKWKAGLADWDQDGDRVSRLKAAAEVRVYTPGSRTGVPLSLLRSLRSPGVQDEEDSARQVTILASSLLSLAGITEVAAHSREQALLAAILMNPPEAAADLPWLVQQIQRPAFSRIGVLDLETFYPARERQDLALRFNSVLAVPGFELWTQGEPLDIARMLHTPEGRPRIAIVSIAHLDDAQRMAVVSLLLGAVLEWTRRQSGTSSLRALLYMDEVFGYLPPVANPPSKLPLLTLLKQARASGLGVMLATQNPVDLDYKALSNAGTWFLGKLQTERDKARVLDGLEGVAGGLTREELDRTLSATRPRVFLMHNVHDHEPVVFETRWALSYLRGPLNREDLRRATGGGAPDQAPVGARAAGAPKPVLPAGIDEYYLPSREGTSGYAPVLYGCARVRYSDTRRDVDVASDVHAVTPLGEGAVAADWEAATDVDLPPDALRREPDNPGAGHVPLPADALNPRKYREWARDFEQWVVRAKPLQLFSAPAFKLSSRPGETRVEFLHRVQHAAREARDTAVDKLRTRYEAKAARASEKVSRATEALAREQQQVQQQKLQTAVSFGATLVGALMGRKAVSVTTLGRATTAARGVGRAAKEAEDVARAKERLKEVEDELQALDAELQREIAAIEAPAAADPVIETVDIKPKAGGVDVRLVALAWAPESAPSSSLPAGSHDSASAPTRLN
jgi:hypothetical protein